jgi:pantetheine-phosphate adenylyltransferase
VFSGLAVEFAKKVGARSLVRGLRTEVDFTYEMQMALMNRSLAPKLETIFIPTAQEYGHVSSSLVKEIASFGGDTSSLVPPIVCRQLTEKFK